MSDQTHTTADIHQEKVFKAHIVACLNSEQGYIERDRGTDYSVAYYRLNSIRKENETWQS